MFCSGRCRSKARLDGKTAVITGCNTGIGKETAKDFYKRGARVVMASRKVEKTEEAAEDVRKECEKLENLGEIVVMKLDLSSLRSVRECAEKLLKTEQRIDILVNNAGVMACPKGRTEDGFETQIGTNHLGHFLFTLLLLPTIVKSTPARIVNVSSAAHLFLIGEMNFDDLNWEKRHYSPSQAYCSSKMANILFTKELSRKLKEANIEGVTTYSLHPGVISTELHRHVAGRYPGGNFVLKYMVAPFFKSPKQGAQTTIYCAVAEKTGKETGLYYSGCKATAPSAKANKIEDGRKLWDVSLEMVKLPKGFNPFVTI